MIIPLLPTFFLPDFDFPTTSATTWEIDPPKYVPTKSFGPASTWFSYVAPRLVVGPTRRTFVRGTWELRWERVF